jgi:hypothetical protein
MLNIIPQIISTAAIKSGQPSMSARFVQNILNGKNHSNHSTGILYQLDLKIFSYGIIMSNSAHPIRHLPVLKFFKPDQVTNNCYNVELCFSKKAVSQMASVRGLR